MYIEIEGRNVDISSALRQRLQARLDELADRYSFLEGCHVVCSQQRNVFRCEITLHVKHTMLRAEEGNDDLGTAVDGALTKLEKQLRRHKGRLIDRSRGHREAGREAAEAMAQAMVTAPPVDGEEADTEDYEVPRVVRVKQIPMKPMSTEEAALQMELLGHDFYVFTNDESQRMNVLYRRRNGDFGLIQPE